MKTIRLLDGIENPRDLKRLAVTDLPRLASEIRQQILETVSENGGHLSSNLGAVELAIALHYVYDTPNDRIVWDVGHQAYPHKLLTGRLKTFSSIRQYGGISGFLKRNESPYDAFGAGHAATSISAALGMHEGIRHKNKSGQAVAVIGDGGLTCGLAFEGLNQAGDLERDLTVVLNHNAMSISGNVGALSTWFSEKMTGTFYQRTRAEIKRTLASFPTMGPEVIKIIRRLLETSKVLLTPGILFEGFNFQYVGPVDGHNLESMINAFERVRSMDGPVLVHVVTKKGKGYKLAENDPEKFHGIGAFDLNSGLPKTTTKKPPSYTSVFGDALVEFGGEHKEIVAITAAMPSGTGLNKFAETFPDRFYDVGIAESHAVTFAAGLAAEGLKPVTVIYSTFLQRAFDQIIHDVALQNLPVLFMLDRGGLVGQDGPTHHGAFDLGYLRMIPNLVVASPKDENELRRLLLTGILHDGAFALRYPRGSGEGVDIGKKAKAIQIGKGEIVYKSKKKSTVLIIAIGSRVYPAIKAARKLAKKDINCMVLNARFVKPLDKKLIKKSLKGIDSVVTIEDNAIQTGFGSAVAELLIRKQLIPKKFKMLGLPDKFIGQGSQDQLYRDLGLDAQGIYNSILKMNK